MQIPIVEIDRDHRIRYANQRALETLAIDHEAIKQGVELEAFLSPRQTRLVNRWLKRVEREKPDIVSVRIVRGNNSEIEVRATAQPITANNQVVGYTLYAVDASQCIILDELVSEEKVALDSLVSNSVAGVAIVSKDNRIEYVNERVCEIVNRTRSELLGHDFREFLHPDSIETVTRMHDNGVGGKDALATYEFRVITSDGRVKRVLVHVMEIVRYNGTTKAIAQLLDVTATSRERRALHESEERYRVLVETMADGLAIDENGRFAYVNDALCRMLGYTEKDLIGEKITKIFEGITEEEFNEKLRMRKSGKSENYETRLKHKNGLLIPVIVSASPMFGVNGEYMGSFAIFTDISKQKETERLLRVASDRALFYLDVMAHDIGNQHQIISGYTELLATMVRGREAQNIIAKILNSIEKCNEIIATVRTSDKLITADMYERDLNRALRESLQEFAEAHEDATVTVTLAEPQAHILADDLLGSLFTIILQNAYEHNTTGRERHIWVSLDRRNNGFLVTIGDNGPGIPDHEKEILFDTKRRYGGIGLHFARHIIEKYGGTIQVRDRVRDEPQQGALFEIWFPILREDCSSR